LELPVAAGLVMLDMTDGERHVSTTHCPHCGVQYRVQPAAAGKPTRCRRCAADFTIELDEDRARLRSAEDRSTDELARDLATLSEGTPVAAPHPAPPAVVVRAAAPQPDARVPSRRARSAPPRSDAPPPGISAPQPVAGFGAYGRAFRRTLRFPLRSGEAITFGVLVVMVALAHFLSAIGVCMIGVAGLVLYGWYLAYQFNCVVSGAAGDEDLPDLAIAGGWVDDVIVPLFQFVATVLLARAPAGLLLISYVVARRPNEPDAIAGVIQFFFGSVTPLLTLVSGADQVLMFLLFAAGLALWPMFVLVVAVGGSGALTRIDLMVQTVQRTWRAYVLTAAIVYASEALVLGVGILQRTVIQARGATGPLAMFTSEMLLLTLAGVIIEVYTTIVAMRMIGFYYCCFKERFAWSWG
jgi:hypothetical protein